MLYDNAQLVNLYLDAYLVSGEARHADTARDIIGYVLRDMTHPEGGFYSAEDADRHSVWPMRRCTTVIPGVQGTIRRTTFSDVHYR